MRPIGDRGLRVTFPRASMSNSGGSTELRSAEERGIRMRCAFAANVELRGYKQSDGGFRR